jgi:hypothetical protein
VSFEPLESALDTGRILDVVLQIWAISIVAILAGSFGAFFHHRGDTSGG